MDYIFCVKSVVIETFIIIILILYIIIILLLALGYLQQIKCAIFIEHNIFNV